MSDDNPATHRVALEPEVVMQLAAGYMFDQWATMNNLIKALQIRVNAGHATRSHLELLTEQMGGVYNALQAIRTELQEINAIKQHE